MKEEGVMDKIKLMPFFIIILLINYSILILSRLTFIISSLI